MSIVAKIVGALRGQRLAILGERYAGKTHLQTFLRSGTIPAEYAATLGQAALQPSVSRLFTIQSMSGERQKMNLAIKRGYDVPGSAEAVAAWREVLETATIMLYLFRADYVFAEEEAHLKRVSEDARLIAGILRDRPRPLKAAALIGTHYDLVPGYQGPLTGTSFYRWHTLIENNPQIAGARKSLRGGMAREPALVVGSMRTLGETQELAFRLFAQELNFGARW